MSKRLTYREMVAPIVNATPKSIIEICKKLGIRHGDGRAAVADVVFEMVENGQAARQWDEDGLPLYTRI